MKEHLELCICGSDISGHLRIDSVYPLNRERTEWNVTCQVHNGGCGRTVYAATAERAIQRWNDGYNDEFII